MLHRKTENRIVLAVVLLALLLVPLCAQAAAPDFTRLGIVSVTLRTSEGVSVGGAVVELYHVGEPTMNGGALEFIPTSDFAGSGLALTGDSGGSLAAGLYTWVQTQSLQPEQTEFTDDTGNTAFTVMPGLYLLAQKGFLEGANTYFTEFTPFLIYLPVSAESGTWSYTVDATPKVAVEALPTPEPTPVPTTPPGKIPQTGLEVMPLILIALGGLVLVLAGWALLASGRRKTRNSGGEETGKAG